MQIFKFKKVYIVSFVLILFFGITELSFAQPVQTFPGTPIPITPASNSGQTPSNQTPSTQTPTTQTNTGVQVDTFPGTNIPTNPTNNTAAQNNGNGPVIVNPDPAISGNSNTNYAALAPLPGLESFDSTDSCAFGKYLNIVIKFLIALGAVMAMVMIVIGGMEYITSGGISSKESGKEKIKHAILGLLLALASYLILNSINPALLNICLDNIPKASIEVIEGDELATSFSPVAKSSLESLGISCPGSGGVNALASIASSFNGKVTYSQSKRGTISNNTVYLDCSSFVKQVYQCAGLSFSGYSTATMFTGINSEAVSSVQGTQANGVDIEVGNLLGWKKGQSSRFPNAGHVVMYIGNGKFIEVHGGGGTNSAVSIRPLSYYAGQFKQIMRTP